MATGAVNADALVSGIPFIGGGNEVAALSEEAEEAEEPHDSDAAAAQEERSEQENKSTNELTSVHIPRHIALSAFHPGHDYYRGGRLIRRNVVVWCVAGELLKRFDDRARAEMLLGTEQWRGR